MVRPRHEQDNGTAAGDRLDAILVQVAAQRYPPLHRFSPEHCSDIDLRIARDGRWYYRGSSIERPELVRLFASVLRREGNDFYLVTPAEKLRIVVEDAPYVAIEVTRIGRRQGQRLLFRTQTDELVIADGLHPIRVEEDPRTGVPAPYVRVRDELDARIARPVFYELVDIAVRADGDPGLLGVWSAGAFFPLGRVDAEG